MTESNEDDRLLLRDAAREGGRLAMTFFRRACRSWSKEGGSPVTEADMAVDRLLRRVLLAARPDYGWLSEETADDPARRDCRNVFVVDPIDGTRGFIDGDRRWCVSLAVVRDGRPVAAALYAPALERLFTATAGGGAETAGRRLRVSPRTDSRNAAVGGPKGWLKSAPLGRLGVAGAPYLPSLAYRFTLVAEGTFDAAFARPRAHDWDLAAADLLVHEAGGRLTGLDGERPRYNRETLRHGVLVAGNPHIHPELVAAVGEVARQRDEAGQPA